MQVSLVYHKRLSFIGTNKAVDLLLTLILCVALSISWS